MSRHQQNRRPGRHQRGFSMVELMVAMAITVTLSAGMLNLLMSTRTNNLAQNLMEQLQDDQRLVLTRLIDTVQNAGYVPTPATIGPSAALPTDTADGFGSPGQSLGGSTGASAAASDTLLVRYQASGLVGGVSDGVMDCSGSTNAAALPLVMINTFSVDASGNLNCTANGNTMPLASGVSNFKVLYGVDTNGDGAVDEYLSATAINAQSNPGAYWVAVMSVRVTVTFQNPMLGKPGQTSTNATMPPIVQIIPVLNLL